MWAWRGMWPWGRLGFPAHCGRVQEGVTCRPCPSLATGRRAVCASGARRRLERVQKKQDLEVTGHRWHLRPGSVWVLGNISLSGVEERDWHGQPRQDGQSGARSAGQGGASEVGGGVGGDSGQQWCGKAGKAALGKHRSTGSGKAGRCVPGVREGWLGSGRWEKGQRRNLGGHPEKRKETG